MTFDIAKTSLPHFNETNDSSRAFFKRKRREEEKRKEKKKADIYCQLI